MAGRELQLRSRPNPQHRSPPMSKASLRLPPPSPISKIDRCLRLEPAPRGLGWLWAWTFDDLASAGTNRSLRACRARRLREERRQVLAELEAEERYELTDLGRA